MPYFRTIWSYDLNSEAMQHIRPDDFGHTVNCVDRYEAAIREIRRQYDHNPSHIRKVLMEAGIWVTVAEFSDANTHPSGLPRKAHALHFRWAGEVEMNIQPDSRWIEGETL